MPVVKQHTPTLLRLVGITGTFRARKLRLILSDETVTLFLDERIMGMVKVDDIRTIEREQIRYRYEHPLGPIAPPVSGLLDVQTITDGLQRINVAYDTQARKLTREARRTERDRDVKSPAEMEMMLRDGTVMVATEDAVAALLEQIRLSRTVP
ncbi:MAG: hypothetical protein EA426_06320 [Spirochaetaceae bacterium]|nr:MAG: hypothetical protein EA426_06320 [Spirochaetaceae bacterium]